VTFCAKCGAEVPEGAEFCPKCGTQMTVSTADWRRHRREERQEKRRERRERSGNRTGPLIGGLILIWLGISLYLAQTNYIVWDTWWPYFIIGVGAILIAMAAIRYSSSQHKAPAMGFLIAGAVLLIVGFVGVVGMNDWWPFVLIAIGAVVIFGGMRARARTPRPEA
jgi:peptidoglycan/LPS O-acetylase OafA/YrhL